VLAAHRATADAAGIEWQSAIFQKVREEVKAGHGLTVKRMTELARVSRASFYRFDEETEDGPDPDMDLRDAIQRIALEWPSYGRRRITAALRRSGWTVNPKRVYRLMREDNLLCIRKRKFVVTTNSHHGRKVYPNLAAAMVLTGTDQLWRADITYIRLREEFVFLAVILDAYSRRVIGWALDPRMEDDLTLDALRMALSRRVVEPGLVHHSDRGSQYASGEYTDLLKENGIAISMSRKANPWDNAACESFLKTLKYEEIRRSEYRDLAEAQSQSASFWRKSTTGNGFTPRSVTCRRRSLKPILPRNKGRPLRGHYLDEFFRHREIYQSEVSRAVRERYKLRPRPHRLDEFPAGSSSAGCSPTLPASASPAEHHSALQLLFRSSLFHQTASSALTACLSPGGQCKSMVPIR
jgi:putative transposase